ncbi:hypothetical protein EAH75_18015 [Rhodanobacter glycinis]|uniref:hypothetical protein n=1 Tax=Rhodanobacter glycinis TaxID=582702 RepID=UPI00112DC8EB|nr:hypothetical protein [Rhodanobacter glycinis]TPG45515.1 hypothetical protein EAH75_18015 [Rhodanobacter glycinis]
MTPDKARIAYPDTWASIQQQVAEVRAAGADVVQLDVRVIDVNGIPTLELTTIADYAVEDDDAPASSIRFRAVLAERPAVHVVH